MINCGRKITARHQHTKNVTIRKAGATALAGALIFTVFLCGSASDSGEYYGQDAYQVFSDNGTQDDKDTSSATDGSLWAYLESVIYGFIYGNR